MAVSKVDRRVKIKKRIRKNLSGTPEMPRLSVFRSNKQFYAQVVDDVNSKTLASAGSIKIDEAKGLNKIEQAKLVGSKLAEVALAAGVSEVVFDRNGYLYHGRVKAFADAAREGGLKF